MTHNPASGSGNVLRTAHSTRHLAVILHSDVAGYCRLSGDDEQGTHLALVTHLRAFAQLASKHGGRKVNEAGDALLIEFRSTVNAVRCAIRFQLDMMAVNDALPEKRRLAFRIGINLGEVIRDRGDLYGDGVNLAARIQEMADPGGICLSSSVYQQVKGKIGKSFDDLGHQSMKNISHSVHVFRVRLEDSTSGICNQPLFDMDRPPAASPVTRGSCLCGRIAFVLDQAAIGTGYCHCRLCQRFSGSPVVAWAAFPATAIRFLNEKPKFVESSRIGRRGFCPHCGSSLTFMRTAPVRGWYVAVHTSSLDNPRDFAPSWHGGLESRLDWFDIHDNLPRTRSDEQPDLRKAWEAVGLPDPEQWRHNPSSVSLTEKEDSNRP